MSATAAELSATRRLKIRLNHARFRARRRASKQWGDLELSQLAMIERAYRRPRGPEVLLIGDSTMYWIGRDEPDNRQLAEVIQDDIGRRARCLMVAGPGYQAGISMAYLSVLEHCRSRPRVVVVPIAPMMARSTWINHPEYPYVEVSRAMCEAIRMKGDRPKRLERPGLDFADAYDRLPAPSFFDTGLTRGELRMLIHARAETQAQKLARRRYRVDYYYAENLTPESPGVTAMVEMSEMLRDLGVASIGYISPVNHEAAAKAIGEFVCDQEKRCNEICIAAFLGALGDRGRVVDLSFSFPSRDFVDPLHPGYRARQAIGAKIAEYANEFLDEEDR